MHDDRGNPTDDRPTPLYEPSHGATAEMERTFSAFLKDTRLLREQNQTLAQELHRTNDSILALVRKIEVQRIEREAHAERQAAWAAKVDDRLGHLVSASHRDHDSLTAIRAMAEDGEMDPAKPWFRRASTWRPVAVSVAFAILASALTACATLRMMAPNPADPPDGGHVTHGAP